MTQLPFANSGTRAAATASSNLPRNLILAVVPDRLDRAAFQRFHALRHFLFGRRLFVHERISAFIMALEKGRGCFAAQVTVDALLIDVEFSRDVLGPFVRFVRHRASEQRS
jgi:DNA polymerase II small subunit/DNA polymerase delta subunit B